MFTNGTHCTQPIVYTRSATITIIFIEPASCTNRYHLNELTIHYHSEREKNLERDFLEQRIVGNAFTRTVSIGSEVGIELNAKLFVNIVFP